MTTERANDDECACGHNWSEHDEADGCLGEGINPYGHCGCDAFEPAYEEVEHD